MNWSFMLLRRWFPFTLLIGCLLVGLLDFHGGWVSVPTLSKSGILPVAAARSAAKPLPHSLSRRSVAPAPEERAAASQKPFENWESRWQVLVAQRGTLLRKKD